MSSILDILKANIWKFGVNLDHRFGDIVFRDDGRVSGYRHVNEYKWEVINDFLHLKDINGVITSIFNFADFRPDCWVGNVVLSGGTQNHYLSINYSYPVTVEFSDKIEEIAKEGRFYLSHFKEIKDVYSKGDKIKVFPGAFIEPTATLPKGSIFNIGAFSYVMGYGGINISMGRYCSVAGGLFMFGSPHPTNWLTSSPVAYTNHHFGLFGECGIASPPPLQKFEDSNVHIVTKIGNDVWIGADCLIKPGISIGDGSIIATRAVVTHDVPPYAIVAGVPARIVKFRFDEWTINRLLDIKWWNYNIDNVPIIWDDVHQSIERIEKCIEDQSINLVKFDKKNWSIEIIKSQVLE